MARSEPYRIVSFRLPESLIARIDEHAKTVSARNLGMEVSRTSALRILVERGLASDAGPKPTKASKRK